MSDEKKTLYNKKRSERRKKARDRKKLQGLCQNCERPVGPISTVFCQFHFEKKRQSAAKQLAKPAVRAQKNKWNKTWREKRVKKGLCRVCVQPVGPSSKQYCERHFELRSRNRKIKKENGICLNCSEPIAVNSSSFCEKHIVTYNETRKLRQQRHIDNGICSTCGNEPLVGNNKRGRRCIAKAAAAHNLPTASYGDKLIEKLDVLQHGRCAACGDEVKLGNNAALGHFFAISRSGMTRKQLRKKTSLNDLMWLCQPCNDLQGQSSWEEFKDYCKILYKHNITRPDLQTDLYAIQGIKVYNNLKLGESVTNQNFQAT